MKRVRNLKIKMRCFLEDGDDIWFIPDNTGILCRYHVQSDEIDFMRIIPDEIRSTCAYSSIVKHKDRLILIPYWAEKITIFYLKTEEFEKIDLPDSEEMNQEGHKFQSECKKNNYLYLIPVKYTYIIRLNMDTLEIVKSENIFHICKKYFTSSDIQIMECTASVWDGLNTVYVGVTFFGRKKNCSGLVIINLDTLHIGVARELDIEYCVKGMFWYEGKLFLYAGEKIILLDSSLHELKSISNKQLKDYKHPGYLYIAHIFITNEKMIFLRKLNLQAVVLDLTNGYTVSKEKLMEESVLYAGSVRNGMIIQPEQFEKENYFYLLVNGTFTKKFFSVENSVLMDCFQGKMCQNDNIFYENGMIRLHEWMEFMHTQIGKKRIEKNIGDKIYECMKYKSKI